MKSAELKSMLWEIFSGLTEAQIMALTIYGEARGEPYEGKVAVGSVILERVEHRDWDGKTLHEVCLMPYQFSCFLPADPNFKALKLIAGDWDTKITRSKALSECYSIAKGLLDGTIPRTPIIAEKNVCQYKTKAAKAAWANKMERVAVIGHHEFYV